jgi:hypothetical protein
VGGGREREGGRVREKERENTLELMIIAPKVFSQIVEKNRTNCLYLPFSQKQLLNFQL